MPFPGELHTVLERLERAGYEAWAVGGGVRDTLRGVSPQDWDVTTSARPEQVMALFGDDAVPTGLQHGTVTVKQGDRTFEVTTYRTDGAYADHRHPENVIFTASLREDLARRDFTVNAMAMDRRGQVIDPYDGQEDLRRGILRCVGEPERRFREDALRIMRCLRFAAQLGFSIDHTTEQALRAQKEDLRHIAVERICEEMTKLLCGNHAARVLLSYPDVFGVFLPEILPCVGLDQRNKHHLYDVWEHTAQSVAAIAPTPELRWAMLLHDLGKGQTLTVDEQGVGHFYGHAKVSAAMAEEICTRLRFSGERKEKVTTLVAWHDREIQRTEKAVLRALHTFGEETFFALCAVKRADNLAQHPDYRDRLAEIAKAEEIARELLEKQACFSLWDLAVNGKDMLALGYRGAAIGAMLNDLLEQVMDGTLPNEKAALLAAAKKQKK